METPEDSPNNVYLTEDKKLMKRILREGLGSVPKVGERCRVHYISTCPETGEEITNTRKIGFPYKVTIGEADLKFWDYLLPTMHGGEHVKITVPAEYGYGEKGCPPKIPPNGSVDFNIEFIETLEQFNSVIECVNRANRLLDATTKQFHAGSYGEASHNYDFLDDYPTTKTFELQMRCLRNLALCYNRLKMYERSLFFADQVLFTYPDDIKSLLRKAEALIELEHFDEANEVIEHGLSLPESKGAFEPLKKKYLEKVEKSAAKMQNTKKTSEPSS